MKTTRLLFLGVLGIFSSIMNVQAQTQTGYANLSVTSFGSGAGVTTNILSNSSFFGYQAGNTITPNVTYAKNSFFGYQAGKNITTGINNTFLGALAGFGTATGTSNSTLIGTNSGLNITGSSNVTVGYDALARTAATIISNNTCIGTSAGSSSSGSNNVFVGHQAGAYATGGNNVLIGGQAGSNQAFPIGSGNVFIGYFTGTNIANGENFNNKLIIENSAATNIKPLIWGDFALDQVKLNGKVGIGDVGTFPTTAGTVNVANYRLFVTGGILADEVRVNLSVGNTWSDYVFYKDYDLKPLAEVEKFIECEGHLPNVPSAKEVSENGIALGEMAKIQQEKIEELTLYLIQQNKEIESLKSQMKALLEKK